MTKHRINARTDRNELGIVKALEQIHGVTVSRGHDDILVGYQGRTFWIEIKDPKRVLNKNGTMHPKHVKDSQTELLQGWTGHYAICWTLDDVLDVIGMEKNPNKLCGSCWLNSGDNDPRCVCGN